MSDKNKVVVEGALELKEVVTHLDKLVASLKEGTVHIQQGVKEITLKPTGIVDLKIEASSKDGDEKLVVKVNWGSDPKYGIGEEVSISAEEPKIDIS